MRNQRLREAKQVTEGHTALEGCQGANQLSDLSLVCFGPPGQSPGDVHGRSKARDDFPKKDICYL